LIVGTNTALSGAAEHPRNTDNEKNQYFEKNYNKPEVDSASILELDTLLGAALKFEQGYEFEQFQVPGHDIDRLTWDFKRRLTG
jgi:hypothetical protein